MRVRLAKASPCKKKGMDNKLSSSGCECSKICHAANSYEHLDSKGTQTYLKSFPQTQFSSCTEVERFLIENKYIRYDSREMSGLDVLFNGIDKFRNLSADHLGLDDLGEEDIVNQDLSIADTMIQTRPYFEGNDLFDDRRTEYQEIDRTEEQDPRHEYSSTLEQENATRPTIKPMFSESVIASIAPLLGYGHSMSHDIFASAPNDLNEMVFDKLYAEGAFDKCPDLKIVATIRKQGFSNPKILKSIWSRYTPKRLEKQNKIISSIMNGKAPSWAKKFNRIWKKLTPAQCDAIECEYFHGLDEKPTQYESAKKLGISISSYQERLEWAYVKLEKIYPEFERIERKKQKQPDSRFFTAQPVYEVCLETGERDLIQMQMKKFSE
jgi:hypothetical protein